MNHTNRPHCSGTWFVTRTPPTTGRSGDGQFKLAIYVFAEVALPNQADGREPWVLHYKGSTAERWWDLHGPAVTPGQPLRASVHNLRAIPGERGPAIANGRRDVA